MPAETRVDPEDGRAYTFDEIRDFYASEYTKGAIAAYWRQCTSVKGKQPDRAAPKAKAKQKARATAAGAEVEVQGNAAPRVWHPKMQNPEAQDQPLAAERPKLVRTRSWLQKADDMAVLPCEEELIPLLEEYAKLRDADDVSGMNVVQLKLLQAHPFAASPSKVVPPAATPGVTAEAHNFKIDVPRFKKWLSKDEGKPFAEKGKGYDDGCYLTSAVLRRFMPRGYTNFSLTSASGETKSVVLRGFHKFTGLTAHDEDEESGATDETDSFMFRGYKRADAVRFVMTTKSNGENGKYTVRRVFGDWYVFAGSKNTGYVWKLGLDVHELYPVPDTTGSDGTAAVGPKIIRHVNRLLTAMSEQSQSALLEEVDARQLSIMVEFNDPDHEHIFPIPEERAEHVAILDAQGFPLPQKEAYALFDRFGLYRVKCSIHENIAELEDEMVKVRSSMDTEGAVIYLELADGKPVGLVKIKSDHYVVARRTRETLRAALVNALHKKGADAGEALATSRERLRKGMRQLDHVQGCKELHGDWAAFAVYFAEHWAASYLAAGSQEARDALAAEYTCRYGSLYARHWAAWQRGERQAPPVPRGVAPVTAAEDAKKRRPRRR